MKNTPNKKEANELIHESSPYLLQHAYNPVRWHPWNEKTLALAKNEGKPMLISIGYSACHWCHVMEKESFEDSTIAKWMNENFICVKVDREERPDVDQIYMNAVQLMTGRGGWPLNCFTTSDGRPFYGGTYFPKENWLELLKQLSSLYKNDFEKVEEYANKLTNGIKTSDLLEKKSFKPLYTSSVFNEGLEKWKRSFDSKDGGNNGAPKFPMPNNYAFLLQYAYHLEDELVLNHVYLSLDKMANGGIYDQIGGGFARYSTDTQWKVPHFEKMLYDNAQLISLYSKAYQYSEKVKYKEVVFQTIDFVKRELMNHEGAFYAALDADSEEEEGKFYVWKEEELKVLLKKDFELTKMLYSIGNEGYWEHNNNILLKSREESKIAKEFGIQADELKRKTLKINEILLKEREKRIRPGLDDKTLTSWNALMVIGLIDAYKAFGEQNHLKMAEKNLNFLIETQLKKDGSLRHSYKDGISTIIGFLEDYSFLIESLIQMYEVSFQSKWLKTAENLSDYCITHFYDERDGMFFYTSSLGDQLIARKKETEDNVIPSSNSSIAKALFKLGTILNKKEYLLISEQMLSNMESKFNTYLPAYTNWGELWLWKSQPHYEVAIVGENALKLNKEIQSNYLPNAVYIGSNKSDQLDLKLLKNKWQEGQTTVYVCQNYSCQLPVHSHIEALRQIKK